MSPLLPVCMTLLFPETAIQPVTDTYHGVEIVDNYRWLEDDNSKETEAWVVTQNAHTRSILDQVPNREKIETRLTELYNYERFSLPSKKAHRYFYSRNDGLQNQYVLYTTTDLSSPGEVMLDPNTLSEDGTISLKSTSVSRDAKHLAYGISRSGSDWTEWKVRNIDTGKDLADHLKWSKFSGAAWAHDGSGFYYSRYDAPAEGAELTGSNEFQKLYFHTLNTHQSEDTLVYQRPDHAKWGFSAGVTDDGHFLIISVWRGSEAKNGLFYKDLTTPDAPIVELLSDFDASYSYVHHQDQTLYLSTDLDAPKSRLISIDLDSPERDNWKEIIAETDDTIESFDFTGGQLFVTALKDAQNVITRYTLEGKKLGEIALPGLGSAGGFNGKADDSETFYYFTSFNTPAVQYRYDIAEDSSTVFKQPKLAFDPDTFETTQIFVTSKDGTQVPSFVVSKKGLVLDGSNPTLLYGYGGFSISLTPSFSPTIIQWLEMGGVYVMTNLRGGAEYGEDWHRAGMRENKQNVFDDFIATAEHLISEGYTRSEKLAISGGSNGGLLVGACMTQRPELFGAALPAVGVLDMLRYHKFTIGWAWVPEYGSSEEHDLFPVLHSYSPYHNLRKGTSYPATMILTGDHDDRVVPAHSFKFAAALQEANGGDKPMLIRIETNAGHGAGTPTSKRIAEAVDKHSFLKHALNIQEPTQP